ncbi:MAG: GTPase ObgE [Desulfobacteraceae bacterium]|nr:GTPase ObgE [Desulfobacteraceae bacterium]
MKFIDEVTLTVSSGNGGSGCVSFRRERFIPKGGPDGGDGGKGGDIILRSTLQKRTLYHFQFKRQYKAEKGRNGGGSRKTGRNGKDIILDVPVGTLVKDADNGQILKDFTSPDDSYIIASGGIGGQGNSRFKSSTRRTPRFAQPGEPGQTLTIRLELKLLADVGIIGLPNAGKSTLIRALSSATPKVGNYPFTTLTPSLGMVETGWGDPFVVADIPGLIEGAHTGAGLGIRFLRHVERTRILVHLVDVSGVPEDDPLDAVDIINTELRSYDPALAAKPQILVLNKMDLEDSGVCAASFKSAYSGDDGDILLISAETGQGIERLKSRIVQQLDELNSQGNQGPNQ